MDSPPIKTATNDAINPDETLATNIHFTTTAIKTNQTEVETKLSELLLSEMPVIVNQQDEILSPFKWDLSSASSEQPSPSPIFNENLFLSERLDEIPTEFLHGISNINYDFNIFLDNPERSISDESLDRKFRSDEATMASINQTSINIDEFDPLKNVVESPTKGSIIDRPVPPMQNATTLEYMGFSHFEIPSISCTTGPTSFTADLNDQMPSTSGETSSSSTNNQARSARKKNGG